MLAAEPAALAAAAAVGAAATCCACYRSSSAAALSRPQPLVSEPSHAHPQFPGLPTLERAQRRSKVVRVPNCNSTSSTQHILSGDASDSLSAFSVLSAADITAIHTAANREDLKLGTEVRRWDGSSARWEVPPPVLHIQIHSRNRHDWHTLPLFLVLM